MKTALLLGGATCFATPLCIASQAISPERERLFDQFVQAPTHLTEILEGVQSKEQAEAACKKLNEPLANLLKMREEMQKISELSPAEKSALEARYENQIRVAWGKLYEQIFRLQKEHCYGSARFSEHFQVLCLILE